MSGYRTTAFVPPAGGNLAGGVAVTIGGDALVAAADETEAIFGVTLGYTNKDDYATVITSGVNIEVAAHGSIDAGQPLIATTGGKVKAFSGVLEPEDDMWIVGTADSDALGGRVRATINIQYVPARDSE